MPFTIHFTPQALLDFQTLENDKSLLKRLKAVSKALHNLKANPCHPSLNIHKYNAIIGEGSEEIFEAYAENNTPAAYRIFWHYGKGKGIITVIAITPRP